MTKTMDYNGDYLVYKKWVPCKSCTRSIDCNMCDYVNSCKGCFFEDEPTCPYCFGEGIWVEASK